MRRLSTLFAVAVLFASIAAAGPVGARNGTTFSDSLAERFPQLKTQPLSWAHSDGEPVKMRQPDGRTILLVGTAMDTGGAPETLDGYSAIRQADGWWAYAVRSSNGGVVTTGRRIGVDSPQGIPLHAARVQSVWIDGIGKDVRGQVYEALRGHSAQLMRSYAAAAAAGKAREFKIPALMLNTRGHFRPENTPEHFARLLSGTRDADASVNPRGTMSELYLEMSWGVFEPTVDVYGIYQSIPSLVDPCWYGTNKPQGDISGEGPPGPTIANTVIGMAPEAVAQADKDVDFSQYDNDGDGAVDFLLVIHSGPGAEATLDLCNAWSHYASLATAVTADGVIIQSAMTIPEINLQIGVAAHEFMHALGEPDYYDTDGSGEGTGEWDLGGGGPWLGYPPQSNSVHLNPLIKTNLGWIKPRLIKATTHGLVLRPRELYKDLAVVPLKITSNAGACTANPKTSNWCYGTDLITEGFMLEMNSRIVDGKPNDARLPRGAMFDRYSHADGLMVWHFDTTLGANADETHARLDLEEADFRDGLQDIAVGLSRGDPLDLFYDDATGISSATVAKDAPAGGDGKPDAVPSGSPWTVVSPPAPCAQPDVDCPSHPGAQPVPTFTVTDDPDNVVMRVRLDWTNRSADDWDLYVDRNINGTWTQIANSSGSSPVLCSPDTVPECATFAVPDREQTVVLKPPPGEYRVRAVNWAGPTAPTATASVEFQPTFGKGSMPNTLDWMEKKSGWSFTNIRPEGEGVRLDLIKHTNASFDLSPEIVRTVEPLVVGRAGALTSRVYNHGGRGTGPVTLTIYDGANAIGSKTISKIPAYDFADVSMRYTPSREGVHAFSARVNPVSGEAVAGNNVQDGTLFVGGAGARVLVVDDDQGYSLEQSYAGALEVLGVPYAVADSHASLAEMKRYDAVIWAGGSTQRKQSIDAEDRATLSKYLDGGGRLLLTGSRMAYGVNLVKETRAWFQKYFGAGYAGSWQFGTGPAKGLGQTFGLELAPGRSLLDELTFEVTDETQSAPLVGDAPTVKLEGIETYRFDPEGEEPEGVVGARFAEAKFKTEVQDFTLAQVPDAEVRVSIMKKTLSWLGVKYDGSPTSLTMISAIPGGAIVASGNVLGSAADSLKVLHAAWRLRLNGSETPIVAAVTGNPSTVELAYRKHGASSWTTTSMVESTVAGMYEAMIPGKVLTPDGIDYRIVAAGGGTRVSSPPSGFHSVTSAFAPKAGPMKSIVSPGTQVKGKTRSLPSTGVEDQFALALMLVAVAVAIGRRLRRNA